MHTVLHLTADERAFWDALSAELQEGWTVEKEARTFDDSHEKRLARLSVTQFSNPELVQQMQRGAALQSFEDIADFLEQTELQEAPAEDTAQLLFVLGPDFASTMIALGLATARTDEDIRSVAALSALRGQLLDALLSTFSSAA